MRILIASDSHNKNENVIDAIRIEQPIDLLIHCGDIENGEDEIKRECGCPMVAVQGNNDFFTDLPKEIDIEIGKYKVWITHGHYYYVGLDNKTIKKEAICRNMDIVFYGHSHRPVIDMNEGVIAINPGSISYPRQDGKRKTYCMMKIDEEGNASFEIKYL